MSIDQISSLKKIIISQYNHWVFFGMAYFFMVASTITPIKPGLQILIWFSLGCLPYLFYTVKKAIHSTALFLGVHLLTFIYAIVLPTPHQICKVIYVGCTLLYCAHSVFFRYSAKEAEKENVIPLPVPFGVTFALLLMLQFLRKYEYQSILVNILVLNVFLYCLARYVENYAKFLSVNKHSVGYMPVKNIFHTGVWGMGIFAFIMSAILFFVANLGDMNDVVHKALYFIGKIIKKIRLVLRSKGVSDLSIMEDAEQDIVTDFNVADSLSTSPIWDILATVLFYLIIIYVLYKIVTLLPYILRFFKMPAKATEEEKLSITDIREQVQNVEKAQRKGIMSLRENLSPARRIRKYYKKKIEGTKDYIASKGKRDCMEWYTARECATILNEPVVSELYEKARYSPYDCTAEDVKKMKTACKNSKI